MKKLLLILGLSMFINSGYSQVSVDDDEFPAFVKAQNEARREMDSLDNLRLLSRIEKFDTAKVVETPKPVEIVKVVDKSKVVKKEIPKSTPIVAQVQKTEVVIQTPKIKEPLNKFYIEDNYYVSGNSVFSENHLAGIKFECSLRDKSYILFKIVKRDVALNNPSRLGEYFIGTYFVPITWWNENNTTGSLTYDQIEYIKDNFQIKYKNEN